MSRFSGWNTEAINKVKPKKKLNNHVQKISDALTILKIEHRTEYKFLHDRRFRFDLAIPKHHIAIEFEGGIYSNGRHVRGKGYAKDCKKYNLATMHGWKLLRYTTDDTKGTNWELVIAKEIKEFIKGMK